MSMLAPELDDCRVLDLFAGCGALGLEALSRGARHATFVEVADKAIQCINANIRSLDAGELSVVVRADVFDYIDALEGGSFDIALADPPYGEGCASQLIERYERGPFARILAVEYEVGAMIELPPGAGERRYGDTVIAVITANLNEEDP